LGHQLCQPLTGVFWHFKFHPNAQLIQHLQHPSKLNGRFAMLQVSQENVADPRAASGIVLADAALFANGTHGRADLFDTANRNAHDDLTIETYASILAASKEFC
jgi:hypothetical protein